MFMTCSALGANAKQRIDLAGGIEIDMADSDQRLVSTGQIVDR
jgi:hypothetical protein